MDEASGDAWGTGLGAETRLPQPPPAHAYPGPPASSLGLVPQEEAGPKGWRKVFAIAGIVFAFPFLLTIPGWVALSAYKRWKAGERGQPTWLIVWGILGPALFVLLSIMQLRLLTDSRVSSVPVESPAGVPGEDQTTPIDGLLASPEANGWTRYTSDAHGFSISLPPGWSQRRDDDLTDDVRFVADDLDPPYSSPAKGYLFVSSAEVGQWSPRSYYLAMAHNWYGYPETVGKVTVVRARLPAGNAWVLHLVMTGVNGGPGASVTIVGFLHGTTATDIVFMAPVTHANSYGSEFNDIAKTFTLVE